MDFNNYADSNEENGGGGIVMANNEANKSPISNNSIPESKMALTEDNTKVKFTNANNFANEQPSRNGEAKVEIENVQVAFAGMGKEELMKFANDPFWIRLRWFLLILFWLIWLAMLVGAIVIIVFAKKCEPLPTIDWWQKSAMYHIFPFSFQDSNGDGVGDLAGVESRADYFEELGTDIVLLSPVYASLMSTIAYNVNDTHSHPLTISKLGSLEDFDNLSKTFKDKGIKLIIDFDPNQSNNVAFSFHQSQNREPGYEDYYIWANGTGSNKDLQSNLYFHLNETGDVHWKFDPTRQQYYLHYSNNDPILNLRNPSVRKDLEEILTFWLDKGVSGFKLNKFPQVFPYGSFTDDGFDDDDVSGHSPTLHILQEWRDLFNRYEEDNGGGYRVLIINSADNYNTSIQYYGNDTAKLVDLAYNLELLQTLDGDVTGSDITKTLTEWLDLLPKFAWPGWMLGNQGVERVSTRLDPQLIDGLHMITMLLRGTPITYYGEEIGMINIPRNEYGDYYANMNTSCVSCSPMQWNDSAQAGFSSDQKIKFPSINNYTQINVEDEKATKNSHLKIYQSLVKLRNDAAIQFGSLTFLNINSQVLSFSRVKKGSPGYVILVNFDKNVSANIDLHSLPEVKPQYGVSAASNIDYAFPIQGTVEIASRISSSNFPKNSKVKLDGFVLQPKESVVIKFVPRLDS